MLLNNRFEQPVDFTQFIKGPDTLTLGIIVKTLYDYRSSIAHGSFTGFEKNLEILKKVNPEHVYGLLSLLLKRVITQALIEPQLITDLKKC
jgi:hypothetical protein